ncbi:MAG: hypothetical protein KJ624_02265 [Chloroflexi bacterium]|nr:hypothetical protein [Chloroflexota bacterium]
MAEKVVAHIEFFDTSRSNLIFPAMVGRWSETPERAQVGPRVVETNQVDIAPNAMPRRLDIVLKYQAEADCYGLNNDTPQRAPSGWRDMARRMPPGRYAVRIRLRGVNVDSMFWFSLENGGLGQQVSLQPAS